MREDLTLAFAGDLAPLYPLSDERCGPREVWEYLRSADIAVANLELPLTSAEVPADKAITLRADPGIVPSIRGAGVDVATVANNHAMDYGPDGLLETIEVLERAGVVAVGGEATLEKAMRSRVVSVGGLAVTDFGARHDCGAFCIPPAS